LWFHPIVELLDMLRPGGPEDGFSRLVNAPRLIIDDIGSQRETDWTAERFFALVNRRWMEQRPTIATSNLGLPDLKAAVGDRAFSRLVGSDAVVLKFTGRDRRMAK
jgi:DNA replication protein DnaC